MYKSRHCLIQVIILSFVLFFVSSACGINISVPWAIIYAILARGILYWIIHPKLGSAWVANLFKNYFYWAASVFGKFNTSGGGGGGSRQRYDSNTNSNSYDETVERLNRQYEQDVRDEYQRDLERERWNNDY